MNARSVGKIALVALVALGCSLARAQSPISENFTGSITTNQWLFYNGACLTAGSTAVAGSIGQSTTGGYTFPGCLGIQSSYYGQDLVGGVDGYLGSSSAPGSLTEGTPDPAGQGALRFTNGYPGGYSENGAIVSAWTFPTNQGIQVQFETLTYRGDSGGAGGDGADGISFYLVDGCMPIQGGTVPAGCGTNTAYGSSTFPGIGSWGGSLAYSCSNTNPNYDGLVGAYLGLGIDEFGNFLNGTTNTLGETVVGGTSLNGASGDNTATGGGYQPGRIGLRGAGDIAWQALTNAYGTNLGSSYPYYPASLTSTCASGSTLYNGMCDSCPSSANGSGFSGGGCYTCPNGDTYDPTHGTSSDPCASCPTTDGQTYTYNSTTGECTRNTKNGTEDETPDWVAQTASSPTQAYTDAVLAVQQTCETGNLYNYSTPSSPVAVTTATLNNSANPAGILDYAAIPNAYSVLSGVQIASESAQTRTLCAANAGSDNGCVMPIVYSLTITPAGLLSLSYAVNGGATQQVIKDQSITTSNGPLPNSFRFGFAGSTGGDTNIHEILCFQAQPSSLSEGSAGVNQQPSAKIESGAFAYFTYYNPDNWTGRLTANQLEAVTSGSVTTLEVVGTPAWDASCVLTGGTCASTGVTDTAEGPTSRVILSWNGTEGIPFKWDDLSTSEQAALDSDDVSSGETESEPWTRAAFLRGDRTNEMNSSGTCPAAALNPAQPCFRERDGVLGDIVDSSPSWVGPPSSPYTATWSDRLYSTTTMPEDATTAQTYEQYVTTDETRENVVYVGANDGLLHGFRTGAYNSDGTFNTSAPNDGYEVLAYMPGATISGSEVQVGDSTPATYESMVDTIHGTNPTSSNAVTTNLDYSNPQYGHNFYVDATPGTGDLFYNGTWHTWVVGGLGAGGAAIYALDVSNPANFLETSAASLVMGEWSPATITCANVSPTSSNPAGCGADLGSTYGMPEIRRLHNGTWGVIFGNGFGSESGDAGIFVMTVSQTSSGSVPTETIYYLSTGTAAAGISNNGIAYVTPADLDGDHITDYVYAGDLKGNIWRFDLTSSNPANWGITRCLDAACQTTSTAPLFTTQSGQPITTQLVVASGQTPAGAQTLVIAFGTGQKLPFTNTGSTSFATGTQSIYGVWDWAMANWNSKSATQYAALTPTNTGLSSPAYTLTYTDLEEQQFTNTSGCSLATSSNCDRDISGSVTVCWEGTSACSGEANNQFGWYVNLPGTGCLSSSNCPSNSLPEQIVFNPELVGGAFLVNSTIPPSNTLLSCTTASQTGYTYALQVLSGGSFNNFFPLYNDASAAGVMTDATGTSFPVQTANGESWLVFQTYQPGATPPAPLQINQGSNSTGERITWTELR